MIQKYALVAAVGVVLALGLSGCTTAASASGISTVSPAHPIKPAIPSEWALAHEKAEALLATATLPADAVTSTTPPDSAPTTPWASIGCRPSVDVDSYALIRDISLKAAATEVAASVPGGSPGIGRTTKNGTWLEAGVYELSPNSTSSLTVTLAPTPAGDVAARIDAVIAERNADCPHTSPALPSTPAP